MAARAIKLAIKNDRLRYCRRDGERSCRKCKKNSDQLRSPEMRAILPLSFLPSILWRLIYRLQRHSFRSAFDLTDTSVRPSLRPYYARRGVNLRKFLKLLNVRGRPRSPVV